MEVPRLPGSPSFLSTRVSRQFFSEGRDGGEFNMERVERTPGAISNRPNFLEHEVHMR